MKSKIQLLAELEALVIIKGISRRGADELIKSEGGSLSPLAVKLIKRRALSILKRAKYQKPTILQRIGLKKS